MDFNISMKMSGIILLVVFCLVGVSFVIFCWLLRRNFRVSAIISNSVNSNGAPAFNETASTISSIDLDMSRTVEDLPPSYEMGLRSETPPPSFDTLFPSVSNICNDDNNNYNHNNINSISENTKEITS